MARVLKENKLLSIFLGVVAVYVVLWAPVYGFQRSLGEARKVYFMFLIPLLALVAIKTTDDLRKFILVLVWTATSVAMLGLARFAMRGSMVFALNSEGTLILALVVFLMLVHQIYRIVIINAVIDKGLLVLFAVMVIASGQRSVWIAVGFGLVLMFWVYRSRSAVLARMLMISAFAIFGLTVGLSIFPEAGSRLVDKFAGIINPSADENASWRMKRWEYQKERLLKHETTLWFGEGLGGYERDPRTGKLTAEPHNAYVQMVLKLGLFGLIIYALFSAQFFQKTLRIRKKLGPGLTKAYMEIGIVSFAAAHAYVLGYGFMPIILMVFSIAACAVRLCETFSRATNSPHFSPARYRPDTRLRPI
jgi:O-antigen ligase